jgi:large subunit ribosomal protein L6
VPAGVTAVVEGQKVSVKGPKGVLNFTVPEDVVVVLGDSGIKVDPRDDSKRARAMWGMSRSMVANLVVGVTAGYERKLEITGVGYKAAVVGKNLQLSLGYSHDINYPIPAGIAIVTAKPTEVSIAGIDKRRGPEPYKGKGIKYQGEFIFRKEGKKK